MFPLNRVRIAANILGLVLSVVGFCTKANATDACEASALPQEIRAKIDKNYPDWQVEKLEHLGDEDRQLWLKAHPAECPGIAVGHFETKAELSYAVLLVSKPDRKRSGFRVVAFSRIDSHSPYVARLVEKWDQGGLYNLGSDQVIATVPPGHYEEAIGPKNTQIDLLTPA